MRVHIARQRLAGLKAFACDRVNTATALYDKPLAIRRVRKDLPTAQSNGTRDP